MTIFPAIDLAHAPYLVLGARSDTPIAEVTAAFANATRKRKSLGESAPFSVEDLTSALARIESKDGDEYQFSLSVPADSGAVEFSLEEAERLLNSGANVGAEELAQAHLRIALEQLLSWEWSAAEVSTKEALRFSRMERTRDEALNINAVAAAMQGDGQRGVAALQVAVQGDWNYALQQNLGILAIKSNPELAAEQSAYWLDASETVDDRVAALYMVLNMTSALIDNESDEEFTFPPKVLQSFRRAINEPLPGDVFVMLGRILADHDAQFILSPRNWEGSGRTRELVGQLVLSRAKGFEDWIAFLASQASSRDELIRGQVTGMVADMNQYMFSQEEAIGAAAIGMDLLNGGLDVDGIERIQLRMLVPQEIALNCLRGEDPSEPIIEVFNWLKEAYEAIGMLPDDELKEIALGHHHQCSNFVARSYYVFRIGHELDDVANLTQAIQSRMGSFVGRMGSNRVEISQQSQLVVEWCRVTQNIAQNCIFYADDSDIIEAWQQFLRDMPVLRNAVSPYV